MVRCLVVTINIIEIAMTIVWFRILSILQMVPCFEMLKKKKITTNKKILLTLITNTLIVPIYKCGKYLNMTPRFVFISARGNAAASFEKFNNCS